MIARQPLREKRPEEEEEKKKRKTKGKEEGIECASSSSVSVNLTLAVGQVRSPSEAYIASTAHIQCIQRIGSHRKIAKLSRRSKASKP
jgi:hypothetical protein